MTLPGGAAAKLGHRYEKWWTLSELVRMLRGETDSLRLEPPGVDGVEFIVKAGGGREYHQAKRSHPSGKWSVAKLASAGVLASIGKLLIGNSHRFVFVSGSDARELADLCEGAADAESFEEFEARFLGAESRARDYARVKNEWNCDGRDAWDVLRRIDVRTTSEHELATKVDWGLSAQFLGNVNDLCVRLATIVDHDVHRTIARDDLSSQLAEAGFPLRKVSSPYAARQAVVDATDRYLRGVRRNLIQGTLIPRTKTAEVIARLTGERPSDCVLTGQAGAGKTGCVMEVVDKLRANGVQVLAFRLDRHMSATTTTDLGQKLGLEESPALVLSAAAKVAGASAVLIIDQLDAVSAMSGRASQAFDVVERLLVEAKAASIGTVVVCRVFDWRHDPRLRRLVRDDDREIKLDELLHDDVHHVLTEAGLNTSAFSPRRFDLLRLPQNLSLFFNANISPSTAFSSNSDLLRYYWDEKRKSVAQRAGQGDQWIDVMGTMCDAMSETQQLSVREEKLDRFSPGYLEALVSEGVFAKDDQSFAFGHESFFDYCFARLFVNKETPLTRLLKSSEQHLFRRSQVRQVLVYLREANFERYVKELEGILSNEEVRTHLKDLVFALLATFDDPRDAEWDVWMAYIEPQLPAIEQGVCEDRLTMQAWWRIFYAKSWFKHFDKRGMIAKWLAAGGLGADLATRCLSLQQRYWPDRVAEHLEPYVDHGGEWVFRLQNVLSMSDYGVSRRQFDLFLRLLDSEAFDTSSQSEDGVWRVWRRLGDQKSEWIPELVAHLFHRWSRELRDDSVSKMTGGLRHGMANSAREAIDKAAQRHPANFIDHVLPAVLDVVEAAPKIGTEPPVRDVVWPYLIKGAHSLVDICLTALTDALSNLAHTDADLHEWIGVLASEETHVANHLLLSIYRGGASRYSEDAVVAFCDQQWRFECGYSNSSYWFATETLKAIAPHCKAASLAELERVVLAYVDPYEKTKEGFRQRGWAAFNLLTAIPDELRSDYASRRFQEWQRKFGKPAMSPRGVVGGIVESPIATEDADNMSDKDWLRAIAAYPSARRGRSTFKDGKLRGGASELAKVFGEAVRKEPARFAHLGIRLRPETNPVYFSELLRGLAGTGIDQDAKVAVCQRVFECARGECGGDITDLLAKMDTPLSDHALGMLVWLALKTEGLDGEDQWKNESSGGQFYFTNGVNTTRGRAALAIGELILGDSRYVARLEPILDELVRGRSAAVGSCAAYIIRAISYHDSPRGICLFLQMDFSEERLLGTRHVHEFMCENIRHEYNRMHDLIARMLRCAHPDVIRLGARLLCMAAFFDDNARKLAEEIRRGHNHQRLGCADVAAANVGDPEYREWCEGALRAHFVDGDVEVREVAASCFRHIPEDGLATYGGLIEAFCDSPAYQDDAFALLEALRGARAALPGLTCLACEKLLDRSERVGFGAWGVGELVFRLYQQHPNDEWTKRALDLIDRLCLEAPDEAVLGLGDFER